MNEGVTRKISGPPIKSQHAMPKSKQPPTMTDHGGKKKLGTFHDGSAKSMPKSSKGC